MTAKEARIICEAKGLCLCGHFETCSVCIRPLAQRNLEQQAQAVLAKAGCGVKFKHVISYARICNLCGKYLKLKPKPLKFRRR